MKRLYLSLFIACALVASCKDPLEEATPSVLKLGTEKISNESGIAHEVSFKVTCDKDFEVSVEDAEWITVASVGEPSNDVSQVRLKLDVNSGNDSRTGKVNVVAGKKSATLTVSQLSVSKLLSVESVELVNLNPTAVSLKFPDKWTLSCTDDKGSVADWFTADAEGGIKDISKTVTFTATSVNLGEEARNGWAVITVSGVDLKFKVTQPVTDILGPVYGIYNYDGAGAAYAYDDLSHQVSMLRRADGSSEFRLVSPSVNQFLLVSGVPATAAKGDKFTFRMVQNVLTKLDYQQEISVEVVKVDEDKVWLLDGQVCYVVKK